MVVRASWMVLADSKRKREMLLAIEGSTWSIRLLEVLCYTMYLIQLLLVAGY